MAEYEDGASGQVENNPYCMEKSFQARNVKEMNQDMGYNNLSDLANSSTPPTKMTGATRNEQLDPRLPADNRYDYDKIRS